jgi:hypothetical protein
MPESEGVSRTATPAERVRLVVALSEAGSSLRCVAVSLEVRVKGAGGRAAYSLWARNCTRDEISKLGVLSEGDGEHTFGRCGG